MLTVRKYFISLILSCKFRKKKTLLRCTSNQSGPDHKLHFQPKKPVMAKLSSINTKMAVARLRCDTDIRRCFISLILSYMVRKKTALLRCTSNQAGTDYKLHFQPKHAAMVKLAAINKKKAMAWLRCDAEIYDVFHIIDTII